MFGRRERGELNLCLLNASVRKWDLRNLTGLYSFETEERWYYWAWYRDVNFGGEIVMLRVHGNLCWVEIVCYLLYRQHWLLESPPQAPKKYKYNFARRRRKKWNTSAEFSDFPCENPFKTIPDTKKTPKISASGGPRIYYLQYHRYSDLGHTCSRVPQIRI